MNQNVTAVFFETKAKRLPTHKPQHTTQHRSNSKQKRKDNWRLSQNTTAVLCSCIQKQKGCQRLNQNTESYRCDPVAANVLLVLKLVFGYTNRCHLNNKTMNRSQQTFCLYSTFIYIKGFLGAETCRLILQIAIWRINALTRCSHFFNKDNKAAGV